MSRAWKKPPYHLPGWGGYAPQQDRAFREALDNGGYNPNRKKKRNRFKPKKKKRPTQSHQGPAFMRPGSAWSKKQSPRNKPAVARVPQIGLFESYSDSQQSAAPSQLNTAPFPASCAENAAEKDSFVASPPVENKVLGNQGGRPKPAPATSENSMRRSSSEWL